MLEEKFVDMQNPHRAVSLEEQIDQWRSYLRGRQASNSVEVAQLEDQLREQVAGLVNAGLATDEAFLVAVKRLGSRDALSREFARKHSDRLWKQLVLAPWESEELRGPGRTDAIIAFTLAVAAALLFKLPVLFGFDLHQHESFYLRNSSLFVLPLLTGYFVWKRRQCARTVRWLGLGFVAAGAFANVYPFARGGHTEMLTVIHLPIALGLLVGIAYAGGRWNQVAGRMDFIRFAGELLIYYALIALGGGVLTVFIAMIFQAIRVDVREFIGGWLVPCGAAGAVLVASWLVETKQSVIENMAPVLTRLFTPLFTAGLIAFLVTALWTGRGVDIERHVLVGFDLLLVVVIGLLLYSVSARAPSSPPGVFDVLQVVLLVSALLTDAVALWAIAARITEFGLSPNRVAALGENVILLVNLAWSVVLYFRFLRGRGPFTSLEKWQTDYLPVYVAWAAIVIIFFPPLFRYT
jgi:hypothetical protein